MNREKIENFLVIPALCFLGLSLCWSAAHSSRGKSADIAELESEFAKVLPPPGAQRQGEMRRIEGFALQVLMADYATGMVAEDLKRYYDGALEKNGWMIRAVSLGGDKRFSLYCKGQLDVVLNNASEPGRYQLAVRRQQGSSFKTGCEQ